MKMVYEYAVVTADEGAFAVSGNGRLHIYDASHPAKLFIESYTGPEKLKVRRILVESPWRKEEGNGKR